MFDGDMSEVLSPTYGGILLLGRRSSPECWVYFTCAKLDQDTAELQDLEGTVVNTPSVPKKGRKKSSATAAFTLCGTTPATAIVIPDDETTPAASTTPIVAAKQAAVRTTPPPYVAPSNYKQLLKPFKARSALGINDKLAETPDFHMLSLPDQMIAEIIHCNSVTQYNAYKTTFIIEYNRSVEAREPIRSIKRWSTWGERQLAKSNDAIGHVRPQKLFRMISCWAATGELRGRATPVVRNSGGAADEDNEHEGDEEGEQEVVRRPSKRRKIRGDH